MSVKNIPLCSRIGITLDGQPFHTNLNDMNYLGPMFKPVREDVFKSCFLASYCSLKSGVGGGGLISILQKYLLKSVNHIHI